MPGLQIGSCYIASLLNPQPHEMDIPAIEDALWVAHRFSNNPNALVVRQHTWLVHELACLLGAAPEVKIWCKHHDDHEGIIGDIPGPLKDWINGQTGMNANLNDLEDKLDFAICAARGIAIPTDEIRKKVNFFDKLAETLEWIFILRRERRVWNKPFENWLSWPEAERLAANAKHLTR